MIYNINTSGATKDLFKREELKNYTKYQNYIKILIYLNKFNSISREKWREWSGIRPHGWATGTYKHIYIIY